MAQPGAAAAAPAALLLLAGLLLCQAQGAQPFLSPVSSLIYFIIFKYKIHRVCVCALEKGVRCSAGKVKGCESHETAAAAAAENLTGRGKNIDAVAAA